MVDRAYSIFREIRSSDFAPGSKVQKAYYTALTKINNSIDFAKSLHIAKKDIGLYLSQFTAVICYDMFSTNDILGQMPVDLADFVVNHTFC